MANFNPPFAETGDRRPPTPTERDLGFPCGPADRELFNDMYHRIEAEIGHVIDYAGITQTDDRYTQLREAIQSLIDAAMGTADTSQYLLMSQARARLPFFPEIMNVDGRMIVTSPAAGTVRMPGGVQFMHRGIFPITTTQQDFVTAPSTTYHLRWDPTNNFRLRPLNDAAYNPTSLPEQHANFDSKYDDMLIARVIMNASNTANITNLSNMARLSSMQDVFANGTIVTTGSGLDGTQFLNTFTLDWARTPTIAVQGMTGQVAATVLHGYANWLQPTAINRNYVSLQIKSDFKDPMTAAGNNPYGYLWLTAIA